MKTLGLIKEKSLRIVALTPQNIEKLSQHFIVNVELGAGLEAGYSDDEYVNAGAKMFNSESELIHNSDWLVTFNEPIKYFRPQETNTIVSNYNTDQDYSVLMPYIGNNTDLYTLNLLPRTTIAQSMDVLSSLTSINGYQAAISAFWHYDSIVPMISGAGGTLRPAKVLVLGAGVAGLQAIATSKRMGAVVSAFDVRRQSKVEVESLGAKFIEIDGASENSESGGYAVEQSIDFQAKILTTIRQHLKEVDIVITTAKIKGKKAPVLIDENGFNSLRKGAVVIDLAGDSGGNCIFTREGKTSVINGVVIVGESAYYNQAPKAASNLIGNNFQSFIMYLLQNRESSNDDIINSTQLLRSGIIVNKDIIELVNEM